MNKTSFIKIITISAALLLILSLCACRPSHKLEKIRYSSDGDITDEEQEQIDIEEDGRVEEFLNNIKKQEALNELADEMQIGPEDDEAPSQGDAVKVAYRKNGEDKNAEDKPSDEKPDIILDDQGIETYEEAAQARAADISSFKQVADASGEEIELPRNVDKVTAVGLAAQIVEMTAGSGRLAGTDSETLSNSFCRLVMSDLDEVNEWWEGNGSVTPISDENFNKILQDTEIDACFEISGSQTFTEEQIQTLEMYNISYVALYPADSIENLKNDVRIVGQVMTNGSGDKNDSVSRAENYISWLESTLDEAKAAAGSFNRYTVFLAGWDSQAQYRLTLSDNNPFPDSKDVDADFSLNGGRGSGLAFAYTKNAVQLFSELASYANVENTSTISTVRISDADNTNYVYVTPVFESFRAGGGQEISGTFSTYNGNINAGYSPFLYRMIGSTTVVALGSGDFPAVIVSSEDVCEHIKADPFWNYSGYCGPLFTGNYTVYVNPSGMGDWISGSLESPIEAKWTAYRICNAYTEDEMVSTIADFYSRFFFANNIPQDVEEELIVMIREMLELKTEMRK